MESSQFLCQLTNCIKSTHVHPSCKHTPIILNKQYISIYNSYDISLYLFVQWHSENNNRKGLVFTDLFLFGNTLLCRQRSRTGTIFISSSQCAIRQVILKPLLSLNTYERINIKYSVHFIQSYTSL